MRTPQTGTRCASQSRQLVPTTSTRRKNGALAVGTVRIASQQGTDGSEHRQHTTRAGPIRPLTLGGAAAVAASLSAAAAASASTAGGQVDAAAVAAATAAAYTPGPVEVGWEIWAGFIAGVIPFAIATVEFSKRILIQRRCPSCRGKGLVQRGRFLRKCNECGGMLPWMGWRYFLLGTADPGNGGVLQQPRGQTSVFYSVPPPLDDERWQESEQQRQAQQQAQAQQQEGTARPAAPAAGKDAEQRR